MECIQSEPCPGGACYFKLVSFLELASEDELMNAQSMKLPVHLNNLKLVSFLELSSENHNVISHFPWSKLENLSAHQVKKFLKHSHTLYIQIFLHFPDIDVTHMPSPRALICTGDQKYPIFG